MIEQSLVNSFDWISEHVFADASVLFDEACDFVVKQLNNALIRQSNASMVVSGGQTPRALYERLQRVDLDWFKVSLTLSDERWLPLSHVDSNQNMIQEYLLKGLASRANFLPLMTNHCNPHSAVDVVSERLRSLSKPYNLVILGMGEDGHVASLFPDSDQIQSAFVSSDCCLAIHPSAAPYARLSLTLSELLNTQRILLLIQGDKKWQLYQDILQNLYEGDPLALPVKGILAQKRVPVHVFWAPDRAF